MFPAVPADETYVAQNHRWIDNFMEALATSAGTSLGKAAGPVAVLLVAGLLAAADPQAARELVHAMRAIYP